MDFAFDPQKKEWVDKEHQSAEKESSSASYEAVGNNADSELDRLLALSRPSAASSSTVQPAAAVQAQQQVGAESGALHAQLEDWLDDVLDM